MTVDTVLFDLDGTLINTNDLIIASFMHTIDAYAPGKYTPDDVRGWIGEPLIDSLRRIDPERSEELMAYYRDHNAAHHNELVTEYPGVNDTVQILNAHGYKLSVVTTKLLEGAMMGLKHAGLAPYFPVVIGLDDIKKAKPDPEPVNRALSQLASRSENAIMIGDSPTDIEAGQAAGTKTVGVAWTIHGTDALKAAQPDHMLSEMPDLLDILGVSVT